MTAGFSPPGRLRLLGLWLGDLLYGVLVSFGWQPREAREKAAGLPSRVAAGAFRVARTP